MSNILELASNDCRITCWSQLRQSICSQSMQHHRCPLMKPFPRLRMQGKLASAIANLTPQVLDLNLPSSQSATALQEPSIVLLPPVNHPSLERQYHLVRICTVISIMTWHQGLRAARAAEVCNAMPATFHPHPHVGLFVVGEHKIIIMP